MTTTAHDLLTLQFLEWVGPAGRSHAETMEAWRSSCPRLSVWEDSLESGLVRLEAGGDGPRVRLTESGAAKLAADGRLPLPPRRHGPGTSAVMAP